MARRELVAQAEAIPKDERARFLAGLPETEMHIYLKHLFTAMQPDYLVEVTHGSNEYGKDLVLVRQDKMAREVTGVVVKRGDVKGTTLGDVDELLELTEVIFDKSEERRLKEISSQVKQAFDHPADLEAKLEELPVTKVWIVLVGSSSSNARRRLRRERSKDVEVRDIDWLVNSFTEFYPEVFFRGATIAYLQARLSNLEASHLLAKTGRSLSEYYVEPLVSKRALPLTATGDQLAVAIREKSIRISSLKRVIRSKRKILLVGEPGAGKSTAVDKLAIDLLTDEIRQLVASPETATVDAPLVITAAAVLDSDSADELMNEELPEQVREEVAPSVLLVDGLDEIAGKSRDTVLRKAATFATSMDCALVITSRKVEAVAATPAGYDKYELLPFEISQAIRLVSKILEEKSALPALKEGIQQLAHQIPMNPLSLMLLVEIVEERQEVPASVTELYDRFTDIALGRFDREKGIEVLFEYLIKKRFLARLAYEEFYCKGRLAIHPRDLEAFMGGYAKEYGWDEGAVESFIREIERAGILKMGEEIFFRHRSFLEYFVASYIHQNRMDIDDVIHTITEIYFDEVWSDVAFYFVGLAREMPRSLMDAILGFTPEESDGAFEKLTFGRLLQAGWYSPTATKHEGISEAIRYALPVRRSVFDFAEKAELSLPNTMSDFVTMAIADMSFGSMVIQREGRRVLEEMLNEEIEDPIGVAALFSAQTRFLSDEEINELTPRIESHLQDLPPLEEARGVIMLLIASRDHPEVTKVLSRRLRALRKEAPKEIRALLPPRRRPVRGRRGK